MIGKAEGTAPERHGHVTALSVAPEYRRLGLSRKFISWLEQVSDENQRGSFVDLYVRCVNHAAITMYESFGYSVYRRVKEYYSSMGLGLNPRDEEDGFGACLCFRIQMRVCSFWTACGQICGSRCLEIQCGGLYARTDEISPLAHTKCHDVPHHTIHSIRVGIAHIFHSMRSPVGHAARH